MYQQYTFINRLPDARPLSEVDAKPPSKRSRKNAKDLESGVIVATLDAEFRILSITSTCELLLGAPACCLCGTSVRNLVCDADAQSVEDILRQFGAGMNGGNFIKRLRGRDGVPLCASWSVYRSQPDNNLICVIRDITNEMQTDHLKQQLLMVTHDLRTPLSTIRHVLEMACKGLLGEMSENGKRMLALADVSASRMALLIDGLLDVERMRAGLTQLQLKKVCLPEVFEDAVLLVRDPAQRAGVGIDVECPAVWVNLDASRMNRVLVNLLSNAVKYSPDKSSISLKGTCTEKGIEIRVADLGRGIPENMLERIFEPFCRVEDGTCSDIDCGSGLGLSICKAIVESHGGRIFAESRMGGGTTFIIHLPSVSPPKSFSMFRPKSATSSP
jgi:signal transduction histidine kinase